MLGLQIRDFKMRLSAQLVDLINVVSQMVASVNNHHFSWCQNVIRLDRANVVAYASTHTHTHTHESETVWIASTHRLQENTSSVLHFFCSLF